MNTSSKSISDILNSLGQVICIAGTQWGDEGKGKLVDILAEECDLVARYAGGANAGHTIYIKRGGKSEKFIFHLIPSGILHENKTCIIGNGCVLDVQILLDELNALKEKGIEAHNHLKISGKAHLLLSYHKIIDNLQEEDKGEKCVGTTKKGIGPAYTDKIARCGIMVADLFDFDDFASKLRSNAEKHMKIFGFNFNIEQEINFYKDAFEVIQDMIIDTTEYIHDSIDEGKKLLVEGAQGTFLDIDHGTYPFVTSSNTTTGGACTGLGIAPKNISSVIGIVKAYTTRVGSGPFPTELGKEEGDMLREQGSEYGSTTGRPRRCGWLDLVVVKKAIQLNGITSINLTKTDVLTGFKTLKIATGYKLEGEDIKGIPMTLAEFEKAEPQYIEMEGWDEDISKTEKFSDLPKNCKAYIEKIEEILEIPINFIGVGVHRKEMIFK